MELYPKWYILCITWRECKVCSKWYVKYCTIWYFTKCIIVQINLKTNFIQCNYFKFRFMIHFRKAIINVEDNKKKVNTQMQNLVILVNFSNIESKCLH